MGQRGRLAFEIPGARASPNIGQSQQHDEALG